MKPEEVGISPLQFMFSVACFIQASALLSSFFVSIARQDSWICVALGMLAAVPLLLIYLGLMRCFPGKNLLEIHEAVYGRVIGSIVSLLFVLFFITLTSLNLLVLGQLVKQTIMLHTPPIVLTGLCTAVCAFAIYRGLDVVTRYSLAFLLLSAFVVIAASLLTLDLWHPENFSPMLGQPAESYVQSTHLAATIPFGEIVAFMMVVPRVKRGKKGIARYLLGGLFIGGMATLTVVARDIAVLGNTIVLFSLPPFETLRMVTLVPSLSRLEILFEIVLIVLLFFKILILYYASVSALAQLLRLRSRHPLVLVTGALFNVYAVFIYPSETVHNAAARETTAFLWTLFELALPLVTLAVAVLRKLPQKKLAAREAGAK